MTLDNIFTGIVTGIIASAIMIIVQTFYEYQKRKKYEQFHIYEFQTFDVDEYTPPEYTRETLNAGNTKVKMELPFDVRSIQVFISNKMIYAEKNVPANSPIYVCCYCDLVDGENEIAFSVKCLTSQHEEREYEYKKTYTMIGRIIGYALILKKQRYRLKVF